MSSTAPVGPDTSIRAKAGKYLSFMLGEETYGVEIQKVREIIGVAPVTAVPNTPAFIRGVINLRGKIIPVVDMREKFHMQHRDATRNSCIVIVAIAFNGVQIWMGLLVDSVCEVLDVAGVDLEAVPSFGVTLDTSFLLGMARSKSGVRLLLDIQKVLTHAEAVVAEAVAETASKMLTAVPETGNV
jgi:purine-binding chemotaxis protein CheW